MGNHRCLQYSCVLSLSWITVSALSWARSRYTQLATGNPTSPGHAHRSVAYLWALSSLQVMWAASEDCCLRNTRMSVSWLSFLMLAPKSVKSCVLTYWPASHDMLQLPDVSPDLWPTALCTNTSHLPPALIHTMHYAKFSSPSPFPGSGHTPGSWPHIHWSYWHSTVVVNSGKHLRRTQLQLSSSVPPVPAYPSLHQDHSCLYKPDIIYLRWCF